MPDPKDVDRGERSHLRLVRFPVGSGEAEVLLDRVPVSIGEEAGFVRVCRDVEGNNLMLFGRHHVARFDLATRTYAPLSSYEAGSVIASAAW